MSVPVPQPPGLPLLGNVTDIDPNNAVLSLFHLSERYGEIFKLNILGREAFFVSSVELLNEICDEKRFHKAVEGSLAQVRNGIGDGLFTAFHGEPNWELAHRVLVPAFGPIGIQHMFDEMYDIATQLIAKWARIGNEKIHATDDYTRLTLDSIALCAMDKRFNSFYSEKMNPFVDAMVGFLVESGRRARRTRIEALFSRSAQLQYEKDISTMRRVAEEVIAHRRANPSDKKDLLNALLFGKDPKTGQRLEDDNIMNNMITFLIAGHETTSGMLSFATYFLLKNPEACRKAQAEVDSVVGKGRITFHHMSKLPYIEAIFREALRLWPTAPAFSVKAVDTTVGPTVLAGKYYIPPGASIVAVLPRTGRDVKVYGADADEFKPERMYGENFTKLPPNAWKPFGNGARGCIGRPFAWQEAILTMALILQNFNLRLDDPSYQVQIKTTLTIKPDNLFIRASLREGIDPIMLERKLYGGAQEETAKLKPAVVATGAPKSAMTILYGSNSGTCEGLAQSLASNAAGHGYVADVMSLDAVLDKPPSGQQPIVIISASYEGNPPDNAATFVEWLKHVEPSRLKDIQYAVFGCGHRDWAATFQKIPKLIDDELSTKGALRLAERGESDVAAGTVFDDFDDWQDDKLWSALSKGSVVDETVNEGIDLELSTSSRASHLRHNVQKAVILSNQVLTSPNVPEKRHIEIKLPTSLTYEAGDYLALLPMNRLETIGRVLRRFGLPWDAVMTLKKGAHTTIPTDRELVVSSILSAYVELTGPATKKNLATIARYAPDEATKTKIEKGELSRSPSVLDVLEAYPANQLPFALFLSMLTPMRVRQYSISSSPLHDPSVATITYSIADRDTAHLGVATNYLKALEAGSSVQVAIKKSHASFHLPKDETTPIIMVCAGTGLAPFRGFVQERSAKMEASGQTELGEALLFIGCRDPTDDKLFSDELERWEKLGAVKVFYAFSRSSANSEGCKHVQDRLWHERVQVGKLFDSGAQAYICGSGAVGKGISEVVARMRQAGAEKKGVEMSTEEAIEWWESLRGERYAVDVFD